MATVGSIEVTYSLGCKICDVEIRASSERRLVWCFYQHLKRTHPKRAPRLSAWQRFALWWWSWW